MDNGINFNELVTGIMQSGFSVGVAAFVLLRVERELKALTMAIHDLKMCTVCKVRGGNVAVSTNLLEAKK